MGKKQIGKFRIDMIYHRICSFIIKTFGHNVTQIFCVYYLCPVVINWEISLEDLSLHIVVADCIITNTVKPLYLVLLSSWGKRPIQILYLERDIVSKTRYQVYLDLDIRQVIFLNIYNQRWSPSGASFMFENYSKCENLRRKTHNIWLANAKLTFNYAQ